MSFREKAAEAAGEKSPASLGAPPERPDVAIRPAVDERMAQLELLVSNVLRSGVIVSSIVTIVGFALLVWATYAGTPHPGLAAVYPAPRGHAEVLRTPAEVAAGLLGGDPSAVVILGLLILLFTPIVRVAVSTLGFAFQRDWTYVAITLYVLAVLGVSFLIGAAG